MPALVKASLQVEEDLRYNIPMSGRVAQSIVMNSLSYADPDLSDDVRKMAEKAPPFSVGQILAPKEAVESSRDRRDILVTAGTELGMFIGVCWEPMLDPLLKGLRGEHEVSGARVKGRGEVIRSSSYDELIGGLARLVSLRTRNRLILGSVDIGPYHFERYDPWRRPLLAQHVFATPFKVWNAYSGHELPESIFRALDRVEVVRVKLERRWAVGPYGGKMERFDAYEGEIHFSLGGLDSFVGEIALALLRLAEFSGVGSRTMQGFGSVSLKILDDRRRSKKPRK
ncbi:MAG: CRISPR system precrRNA processing endoribonuclease RAMP protein Cas6 [Candidatus Korarchaeota archaeon]|nr:CRISPR system precrRNA processing endoribonuclease RAMP protein Cas6 [Candidatus Korarchaeota archaeon]